MCVCVYACVCMCIPVRMSETPLTRLEINSY